MNKGDISKETLNFYDIGARFCGLSAPPSVLEKLILVFQEIGKRGGSCSIKHLAKIEAFINQKYDKESLTLENDRDNNANSSVPDPDVPGEEDKVEAAGDEDLNRDGDPEVIPKIDPGDIHKGD